MHAYYTSHQLQKTLLKEKKIARVRKLAYCDIHLCYSKEEKGTVGGIAKETKLYTLFRIVELNAALTKQAMYLTL